MVLSEKQDRNLALDVVQVTESAAIAAYHFMGGGDERAADQAALMAMHKATEKMEVNGKVCIGETNVEAGGESKLCVGDFVGTGQGEQVDIAVVPLEGKSILARGGPNALSLLAIAEGGGFLGAPSIYMEKIAIGRGFQDGVVSLNDSPEENLANLASAKNCSIQDLVVCLLDRPRNSRLISCIREAGARIRLILDGDVSGVIQAAKRDSGVDIYMGIGGAQEGVLAAAALRGIGGQIQGRFIVRSVEDETIIQDLGVSDSKKIFSCNEMAYGNVTFAATGITYGPMLEGIRITKSDVITHSLVARSKTGTLRYIKGHHQVSDEE